MALDITAKLLAYTLSFFFERKKKFKHVKWDALEKRIYNCRIHKVPWNPPENRKLMRSQLAERSDANRPEGPLKFR